MLKENNKGFIDPLSLIAVGMLLVTLVVGTVTINNKNSNFNINEQAANPCSAPSDRPNGCSCTENYECTSLYCDGTCKARPAPTPTPTHTPTPPPNCGATNQSCSNRPCCKASDVCTLLPGGKFCIAPTPTPSPTPTPVPCASPNACYYTSICSNYGRYPATGYCPSPQVCCDGLISTPTPTPTPPPNCGDTNQSCSNRPCCKASDVCTLLPGGKFCIAPTPTPSPTPTPRPPTPTPISTPTTTPTSTPINQCSGTCSGGGSIGDISCLDRLTPVKCTCTEYYSYPIWVRQSQCTAKYHCVIGSGCNSGQTPTPTAVPSLTPTIRPTATPMVSPTPTQCTGTCIYNSSCSVVGMQSAPGTCNYPAVCCTTGVINQCYKGNSYCSNLNTVAVCKIDKSGYTETSCSEGRICDSAIGMCIAPTNCAGTNLTCSNNKPCCDPNDTCQGSHGNELCIKPTPTPKTCSEEFSPCSLPKDCCSGLQCVNSRCRDETEIPDMVYYSQRDPRWKNKEIICSDGRKDNIENVGCGQTSVAMIIATYGNGSQTPETIADKYFSEGYCDGTGLEELGNVLEDNGFEVESLPAGWVAYESLLNSLRNGGVALLNLHVIERDGSYYGHHSVAIGVNDNNQIIFNDPYYGPNTTLYDKGLDFQIKGVRVVGKGG